MKPFRCAVVLCSWPLALMAQNNPLSDQAKADYAAIRDYEAYRGITDASAAKLATPGTKNPRTQLGMLEWNVWHTWEHYGNIVTYLRINGIVPPSSEPRP